jgi:hypothetical protein
LIRRGDEICIQEEFLVRRWRVDGLLARRVSAKLVIGQLTDLTPLEDVARAQTQRQEQRLSAPVFVPGAGRPTKAQRRALEAWHQAGRGPDAGDAD